MSADPSIGLALIHLPVPHPPAIYRRKQGTMAPRRKSSYLDSLALAEQILGALRQRMEQGGVWDRTAVVVSADHGWRPWIWRGRPEWTAEDELLPREGTLDVPFLVKMPHQDSPAVYTKPFVTVVTRTLIREILAEKVTQAAELPKVIERESTAAARNGGTWYSGVTRATGPKSL